MSPEQYYCMLLFLDTQTPVLCVGNLLCGYEPIWSLSCSLLHENVWIVWCEGHKADLDFACCHSVSNVCLLLTVTVEIAKCAQHMIAWHCVSAWSDAVIPLIALLL